MTEGLDLVAHMPAFQIGKGRLRGADVSAGWGRVSSTLAPPAELASAGPRLLENPECVAREFRAAFPTSPTLCTGSGRHVAPRPAQAPGASVPCAFVSWDTIGGFLSP